MADRTIKPDDTHDLVLQNNDGSAKIEVNEVQTVILTGGSTTALTVDTSGNTTLAGTGNDIGTATGTFNGTIGASAQPVRELDEWELDTNVVGDDDPIVNWSRADWSGFGKIGTGVAETSANSGLFYFPETGYYRIDYMVVGIHISAADTQGYVNLVHIPDLDSTGTSSNIGRVTIPFLATNYAVTLSGFGSLLVSTSGSGGQGFKFTSGSIAGSNEIAGGGAGRTRFSVTRLSGV